nr:response regulator [Nodosilinea nodulosa]
MIDRGLPSLDGLEVCRRLRAQGSRTPMLMLTIKDSPNDIVAGLDAGANDYVVKGCDVSQLLARVRALLRRGNAAPGVSPAHKKYFDIPMIFL